MLRIVGLWLGFVGLILNCIGTFLVIRTNPKTSYDKDYHCVMISINEHKTSWKLGLWFLAVGFILQFIEKGIALQLIEKIIAFIN